MKKPQLILSYAFSLLSRALLAPLKLLPLKKNTALFMSFRGKQYSCNPRAISEEVKRLAGDGIDVVWAFHEPEKFAGLKEKGVRVIGDRGFSFLLEALRARVVCVNTYYKPYLPRRKRQFYLRTWHGGGAYKRVDYPGGLMGRYIRLQQQGASLYLSSSKAFTQMTLRESFGYAGEVLEAGMPRNDVLLGGAWRGIGEKVKKELSLSGKKLLLYAPTYRDDGKAFAYPDAREIKRALSERFGGEWVFAYRGHHVPGALEQKALPRGEGAAAQNEQASFTPDLDLSAYPDMQPLLAAADVLLTDYSSSIWDMSLTGKPAFLYCPDLKKYQAERDFYTDIRTWPYPLSQNSGELTENIRSFDEAACAAAIARHHEALGICESGRAARCAAERVLKECGHP